MTSKTARKDQILGLISGQGNMLCLHSCTWARVALLIYPDMLSTECQTNWQAGGLLYSAEALRVAGLLLRYVVEC